MCPTRTVLHLWKDWCQLALNLDELSVSNPATQHNDPRRRGRSGLQPRWVAGLFRPVPAKGQGRQAMHGYSLAGEGRRVSTAHARFLSDS